MNQDLKGLGVALVTPFLENGQIDFEGLTRLVKHCISGNVDYLVVLGTTAETATLSNSEKEQVISHINKVNNGQIPMVIGIGGNNTQEIINQVKQVDTSIFTAVLSVVPMYVKPSQKGIEAHYTAIADHSPLPVLLYNVPSRTGVNMQAQTTANLALHPNIIGIKEATGDFSQVLAVIKSVPQDFLVISGEDLLALPLITAGGHGVISVVGQAFPEAFSSIVNNGLAAKNTTAYNTLYKYTAAIDNAFAEGNPVGIKATLNALEICNTTVRLPLVEASTGLKQAIQDFIK